MAAISEQLPAYERGWPFRTDFPFWMAGHAPFLCGTSGSGEANGGIAHEKQRQSESTNLRQDHPHLV